MNRKLVALSRMPAAVAAAALVVVLAGCTEAARTTKDVVFPTADLSVALVPKLTEGMPMTAVTLPEAMAGTETLTYGVTPDVPGLSFNPATRVYSGTPTAAGTYPLTYTASTSGGESASLKFTVDVESSFSASFLGTWKMIEPFDDDGMTGTETYILTFTENRYVEYSVRRSTGTLIDDGVNSGTWSYTEEFITRTWHEWDDDNDRPFVEPINVRKDYMWVEGGNVLFMKPWFSDAEGEERYSRYERVTDSIPSLAGVWNAENEYVNDDNGQTVYRVWKLAIDSDNSFRFDLEYTGGHEEVFSIAGTWMPDPDRDFGFLVTVESVFKTEYGEPEDLSHWSGQVLRWAYAPTDNANKIQISVYWSEHGWNADQHQHTDDSNPRHPYGNYWLTMTRAAN